MKTFTAVLSIALSVVERAFPKLPELSEAEVGTRWQPPAIYYFLDDPSSRLRQRFWAVVRLDRNAVSFWRRREEHRRRPEMLPRGTRRMPLGVGFLTRAYPGTSPG